MLVGAAGTPTLESNGELYINASHVAIQTNTTISGVCTATSFSGDGAGLSGVGGDTDITTCLFI